MAINLENLSAAERSKLADGLAAAAETMDVEQKRLLIEALSSALDKNVKVNAAAERKKIAIERINAAKEDPHGGRAAINLLNGQLRRGGIPQVEDLVEKSPDEIMSLFAASKMTPIDRMACKSTLSKLKVIP
jgi:hypothetical protein